MYMVVALPRFRRSFRLLGSLNLVSARRGLSSKSHFFGASFFALVAGDCAAHLQHRIKTGAAVADTQDCRGDRPLTESQPDLEMLRC